MTTPDHDRAWQSGPADGYHPERLADVGAYHCLYDTPDGSPDFVNFLTPLISWVQHGIAPTTIPAGIGTPQGTITLRQKVRPYNALTPVTPAKGSLNGHYHYLGTYQVTHHATPAITSLGRGQNLR